MKHSFRMGLAPNPSRAGCPATETVSLLLLEGTPEVTRLAVVDHIGTCAPCAHELEALRLLHEGHRRIAPLVPERFDRDEDLGEAPSRPVASFAEAKSRREARAGFWQTLRRPTVLAAVAACLVAAFAVGVLFSMGPSGPGQIAAVAPVGQATSADLRLQWSPLKGASAYDVTMSWPTGKVFYESSPSPETSLSLPRSTVAQMKRGQTCLWTVRARNAAGEVIASSTFSFKVDFDPPS